MKQQGAIVMNDDLVMKVDLLVIGAGMAGMTAAALAASKGLAVGVVEKAGDIGGSALLSGGGLIKPQDRDTFLKSNPSGLAYFADLLFDGFDPLIDWISSMDVHVTPAASVEEVIGIASSMRGIDIASYIALCRAGVNDSGGWVVTSSAVEKLLIEDGVVVGAMVRDRDGATEVRAKAVLLATGGFQASPELRRSYISEHAGDMLLRSNPCSTGDGLTLARSADAALIGAMDRFYGHTIPYPLSHDFRSGDYVRLSMPFMSTRSLMINRDGQRFVDESSGYYNIARAVLAQLPSRALLIGDKTLRDEDAAGYVANRTLGFELVDRPSEAARSGANMCESDTLQKLATTVSEWGYVAVEQAVTEFNVDLAANGPTEPSRIRNRRALEPPFFAIEVQPAITFTFGGLHVDRQARVLREDGRPIAGLFAAGADVGGFFAEQYCSGLTMAGVLAMRAVKTITHDRILSDG